MIMLRTRLVGFDEENTNLNDQASLFDSVLRKTQGWLGLIIKLCYAFLI